jgi:orotate phosphoribosyltransferase-like protein
VVDVHLSNRSVQRIASLLDKVREYSIKGCTQRDIAAELQISLGLVEKDLSYLRTNSKENIHKYIDEYLLTEYENC